MKNKQLLNSFLNEKETKKTDTSTEAESVLGCIAIFLLSILTIFLLGIWKLFEILT